MIKNILESNKTAKEIYKLIHESKKPLITYSQKSLDGGRDFKYSFYREEIEDFLENWRMYQDSDNLPKWLTVAHGMTFGYNRFTKSSKLVKELIELSLTKTLNIEVTKFSWERYSVKVNGKEFTKTSFL